MQTPQIDLASNLTPGAFMDFLSTCREEARRAKRPKLVSISLAVDALDPLAVIESIYDPGQLHFYCERPSQSFAIAGADAVLSGEFKGEARFKNSRDFIAASLADTIAVGCLDRVGAGPRFFCAFTFSSEGGGLGKFPAARVFIPRWQVSRNGDNSVAVANFLVEPECDLTVIAGRVWAAHQKFRSFDYSAPDFSGRPDNAEATSVTEVGSESAFLAAVEKAREWITSGVLKKIVLARAVDLEAAVPLHPLALLNGLRQKFPDCYAFSVGDGAGASFIGASPERLARVDQKIFSTVALAGTAGRGRTAVEDAHLGAQLLRSEKDLREHTLVIDSIIRRLAPLGVTVRQPEQPQLLRLSNVQHLCSPLRAELPSSIGLLDLIEHLHPTPAVGGTPRVEACARIAELEPFDRGLYAGALGWVNQNGDGEFFVGLRSAVVAGAHARLFAGAGIVAGSEPEQEYAETELKFRALREAFLNP